MNKAEHYGEWAALWEEAKDVSKLKTSWDRNARESFELVVMALIYQRNAIEMYEEATLHGALRTSEASAGPSIPWPSEEQLHRVRIPSIAGSRLEGDREFCEPLRAALEGGR